MSAQLYSSSAAERSAQPRPEPIRQLWLAFGLFGFSTGWLAAALLENPLVGPLAYCYEAIAADSAGLTCGIAGWVLQRRYAGGRAGAGPISRRAAHAFSLLARCGVRFGRKQVSCFIELALAVSCAGALSGVAEGVFGTLAYGGPVGFVAESVTAGLVIGALCGLALSPACWLILGAARQAAKARAGSVVAPSVQRMVWSLVAVCTGVATLAAVPDWLANGAALAPTPHRAQVILMSASAAAGVLVLLQGLSLIQVRRARRASAAAEPVTSDQLSVLVHFPRSMDAGFGRQLRARFLRATPYRTCARIDALWIGDWERAHRTVASGLRRGTMGLLILATVWGLHGLVAQAHVSTATHQMLCQLGTERGRARCATSQPADRP